MPEGDSIYRAAQALHRALAGKTVTSFETMLPKLARVDDDAPVTGRTIERVTSAGGQTARSPGAIVVEERLT